MPESLTREEAEALKKWASYIVQGRRFACLMYRTFAILGAVIAVIAGAVSAFWTSWDHLFGATR